MVVREFERSGVGRSTEPFAIGGESMIELLGGTVLCPPRCKQGKLAVVDAPMGVLQLSIYLP
jgi:hypothetical protein